MSIATESRPGQATGAAQNEQTHAAQAIPTPPPLNLPMRVDTRELDALELYTVASLFSVSAEQARATIAALRGSDFRSPVLEHIVRAVQRTIWEEQPVTPASVTETAARVGLIRRAHLVELERACHDIIDAGMGAVGVFEAPLVIYTGTLRATSALGIRCQQVAEAFHVAQPTDSIAQAPELAGVLRDIAADAVALADRLDEEVAPR